ncbi:MAG: hypothetical protein QOJ99_901 [Bryobacterales bacterium]|jgi:hypothetical protein|nr:hypothetical protein [Bryobacterales bacterium]
MPHWFLTFALAAIAHPMLHLPDVDGVDRRPLQVAKAHANAVFFVTHDCPISNYYAHEIRRICDEYSARGLSCSLVYTDPTLPNVDARKHAEDYGHGAYPKMVDRAHALVAATGATITPQAVIIREDESIAYRGRIDNFYAALGKPRRVVTERDLRDSLDAVFSGRPVPKPEVSAVGCYIPDLSAFPKQ